MLYASSGWEKLRVVQHALSLVCFPTPAVVHHVVDVLFIIVVSLLAPQYSLLLSLFSSMTPLIGLVLWTCLALFSASGH